MTENVPEALGASKGLVRYSQIANDASGRGEFITPRRWPKTLAKNTRGPELFQPEPPCTPVARPRLPRSYRPAGGCGRTDPRFPQPPERRLSLRPDSRRRPGRAGVVSGGARCLFYTTDCVLHPLASAASVVDRNPLSRPNDAERLASSENRVCASLSLPTRQGLEHTKLEHTELKAQLWRTVPPSLTGMELDLVRADECPRLRRPRRSGHASPLRAPLGASVSLVPPPGSRLPGMRPVLLTGRSELA